MKELLEVQVEIHGSIDWVWKVWTDEEYIKIWNVPFPDWHCPYVENDVKTGGSFNFRMENKDGTEGFDYKGTYSLVTRYSRIETLQGDGRISIINFNVSDHIVQVIEQFEPDSHTELSLQKEFCQSVLNKFKALVDSK